VFDISVEVEGPLDQHCILTIVTGQQLWLRWKF